MQIRCLNLHEFQSKELMSRFDINTQKFKVATTAADAAFKSESLDAA